MMSTFRSRPLCSLGKAVMLCTLLVGFLGPGKVFADLLGITNNYPSLTMTGGPRDVVFDAASGQLSISMRPDLAFYSRASAPVSFTAQRTLQMKFVVDAAGNVVSGVAGPDFELVGTLPASATFPGTPVSGVLLRGEILAFGFLEQENSTDRFDLRFSATEGLLVDKGIFAAGNIGVTVTLEQSTFAGDFGTSFTGLPKANVSPTDVQQVPNIDIEKSTNGVDADDPEAGDAPQIAPGSTVRWAYKVTNTGTIPLTDVEVTDNQGVAVSCPQLKLQPGEMMTCTASGIALDIATSGMPTKGLCGQTPNTPMYANIGRVTGETEANDFLEATDPSHYCNPQKPSIDIEKFTNGVDADVPSAGDAPQIGAGGNVNWTYKVTNTGAIELTNVVVSDDRGVAVSCPQTRLAAGMMMTCTASGVAEDLRNSPIFTPVPGLCGDIPNTPLYVNMGIASGQSSNGDLVRDTDPSHYCNPQRPAIDIEKSTNGIDADNPALGDAPQIGAGGVVNWMYVVTNTGDVDLVNVDVVDDRGVSVSCPQDSLVVGESMQCSASGVADDLANNPTFTPVQGRCGGFPDAPLYSNKGSVTGQSVAGDFVEAADPSHYCNPQQPGINIEKDTNGVDADDPNAGDAPQIAIGGLVTWTYSVTNTGNVTLDNVAVVDDQGVSVNCPKSSLAPGEVMTCSASGNATDLNNTGFTKVPGLCGGFPQIPMYENKGKVSGVSSNGDFVQDEDASHYCNPPGPSITIEKATNGKDADDPNAGDAPQVAPGSIVTWHYVVTNTGNVALDNVKVVDDQGLIVTCPLASLQPGVVMTCSASGMAEDLTNTSLTTVPGLCGGFAQVPMYENKGKVSGVATSGQFVEDEDPSHYCNPPGASITIEKATNGVDADDPNAGDAPQIAAGGVVSWRYVVTNTGDVTLQDVVVTDDQGESVSCPMTTLLAGASMTCSASGVAQELINTLFTTVPGLCGSIPQTPLYENRGKVTGQTSNGQVVQDEDPSHYCNPPGPSIEIEKTTNGVDADDPNAGDAPQIAVGGKVTWQYLVTNTGNVPLDNVVVRDDQGVSVNCPQTSLAPGETMHCSASGVADDLNTTSFTTVAGLCGGFPRTPLYENKGLVRADTGNGQFVADEDLSHYCNPPGPGIDIEKSTNGVDADDPNLGDAPVVGIGNAIAWDYSVTNTGNVTLHNVTVVDDQGVAVRCPNNRLAPGEVMVCKASGVAADLLATSFTTVPGLCGGFPNTPMYENKATVTGQTSAGDFVNDIDPSHYCNPQQPGIEIEKSTNGIDADDPNAGDAPVLSPGDAVTWSYKVINTGNVDLLNVQVSDDQGVRVSCPASSLVVGAMMTCTAQGVAEDLHNTGFATVPGLCGKVPNKPLYENTGSATGQTRGGATVADVDVSHYCTERPAIVIEKSTQGVDADDPMAGDAPVVSVGGVVTWTYRVTNTGDVALQGIAVTDNRIGDIQCPQTRLAVQESMTCTATGTALALLTSHATVDGLCAGSSTKLYSNIGSVVGFSAAGTRVTDADPSHYCNPQSRCEISVDKTCLVQAPATGGECSAKIAATTLRYTGPSMNNATVSFDPKSGGTKTYSNVDLVSGETVLTTGQYSIDNRPGDLGAKLKIYINGVSEEIHTSCSTPYVAGAPAPLNNPKGAPSANWFVEAFVDKHGKIGTLAPSQTRGNDACLLPAPTNGLCTQRPKALSLRFNGGACSQSRNTQDAGKWSCAGDAGMDSVRVVVTGGRTYLDQARVKPGDVLELRASSAGRSEFDSEIHVEVYDHEGGRLQDITLHASCSQDLRLGDKFGAFEVMSFHNHEQGMVRGGTRVEYGFTITNTGTTDISNIVVLDDHLGSITGSPIAWLAPNEQVTLQQSAFVNATTTNTVSVVGNPGAAQCEASDRVTVSIQSPPPAPFTCDKPIDQLTMIWAGTEAVRIKAYKGSVGARLLADIDGIGVGDEVQVGGLAGSPNDVYWEVFLAGSNRKIGESKFHLSCSDADMNGAEDCGKRQGDGKSKKRSSGVNDWLLEGMVDRSSSFNCTP